MMDIPHISCTKIESQNKEIQLLNEKIAKATDLQQKDFFADFCFFKSFDELEKIPFDKDVSYFFALHKFFKKENLLRDNFFELLDNTELKKVSAKDFVSCGNFYRDLGLCAQIAEIIGEYKIADGLALKLEKEADAFNKKFFDCKKNSYLAGELLPLSYNLAPLHRRSFLASTFNEKVISQLKDGNLTLLPREIPLALETLCAFGFTRTAYSLFCISCSLPDETLPFCLAGFIASVVAGINWKISSAGFSHLVLYPIFIEEFGNLKIKFKSAYGKIEISCSFFGNGFLYCFDIPRSATVIFPDGKSHSFPAGSHKLKFPAKN